MEQKSEGLNPSLAKQSFIKEVMDTFVYLFPFNKDGNSQVIKSRIYRPENPRVQESFSAEPSNFFQKLWITKRTIVVLAAIIILLFFSTFLLLKLRSSFTQIENNTSFIKDSQKSSLPRNIR